MRMKRLSFKQWYAIIVLVVFIIYGWLYLLENRYIKSSSAAIFDTWTCKYKNIDKNISQTVGHYDIFVSIVK